MSREETLRTPYGEMMDMMACERIYSGTARQKNARKWTFDEVMRLR